MAEMKGAIFSMAIFLGVIVPFFIFIIIESVQQHAFLKISSEVTEVIVEDGGMTNGVSEMVDNLESKGYTITVFNQGGEVINNKASYGDKLTIKYVYEYNNVRGLRSLESEDKVIVTQR